MARRAHGRRPVIGDVCEAQRQQSDIELNRVDFAMEDPERAAPQEYVLDCLDKQLCCLRDQPRVLQEPGAEEVLIADHGNEVWVFEQVVESELDELAHAADGLE